MNYFFDTSALGKYYHAEKGTMVVRRIIGDQSNRIVISKLSTTEFPSASAKKVRMSELSRTHYDAMMQQFDVDRSKNRYRVVRITIPHFNYAEELVRRIAPTRNLRSLDALQLAVALRLSTLENPITFVCSDLALCTIAASEGLAVLNPETDPAAR